MISSSRTFLILLIVSIVYCAEVNIEQVKVALTGIPDQMSITWITYSDSKNDYKVEYGYDSKQYKYSTKNVTKVSYEGKGNYPVVQVHETILMNLTRNSRVYYRISDDGNQTTEEFSFPTALGNSYNGRKKNVPFKFLTYGDMNVNQDSEDTLRLIKKIIKSDPDVRFIIHQGDIPYAWNGDENIWDRWGDLAQPVTANMPYMVVVGNHESDAGFKAYKHRFTNSTGRNSNSKEGNIYYSFNYQNVHFIGLSTEHNFSRGSRQYNWLKSDLKNIDEDETPFTIIYTHRPMYCSNSNHHEDDIGPKFRDAIEPLFKDYKIDLVLYGHVHAYERTCSISFKSKCEKSVLGKYYYKEPKGTIHLVIGTAGYESNQEWEVKPSWSKYRETSHGLVMITVADNTLLYGKYIRNDETVGDVFMIDKESTPLKKSGLLKEKKSDPVQNPLK